jgi:hypothetical protein
MIQHRFHFTLVLLSSLLVNCAKSTTLQTLDEGAFATPPTTMSIVIKGYVPQAGKTFQHLFVSNFSVKAANGKLELSTARDGMADSLKVSLLSSFGFSTLLPESVVTGFADLLLFNMGITSSQQSLMHCGGSQMLSSSNDAISYNDERQVGNSAQFLGLRDCQKIYMGLNPQKFDNAGNGIPDYMKLRCGLTPTNENEAYISTAGDGVANIDKCKRNIPLAESAGTQPNQLFAYRYSTQLNGDGTTDLTVNNIPILNSGENNFIAFYLTETGLSTDAPALYTAFAKIKSGYTNKTLEFRYWASDSTKFFNQEIVVP